MLNDLDRVRLAVGRMVLALIWLHSCVAAGLTFATGGDWPLPLVGSAGIAAYATLAWWRDPIGRPTRITLAVALIASLSVVVASSTGLRWQLDLHMGYFAELAILAAFCDPVVVLAGAGMTAVHHVVLNFLLPALVFPEGAEFGRVVLHAVIVLIETAALVWLTARITTLFVTTTANLAEAVNAGETARAMEAEAAMQRHRAEETRARGDAERTAAAAAQSAVMASVEAGLERLSRGDVSCRLATPFAADYEGLRSHFNAALAQLEALVAGVVDKAGAIGAGSDQICAATTDLSRRTERQAATLEQTAAALDQITAAVGNTASGANQVQDVVTRTQDDAERSGEVVRQAVAAMECIEDSSRKIASIIGVVDEIAFQTNLLALNAGVEAARAGDAGRGFAVVASEVRALAQRSATAAREIKALIAVSTDQVGTGVRLVGQTGEALHRIAQHVTKVSTLVVAIAASAQEQATGLVQVNTAINDMDQVTQQNAAMVEQSSAASQELAGLTGELVRLTSRFQLAGEPCREAA